jgi:hypothetical protein
MTVDARYWMGHQVARLREGHLIHALKALDKVARPKFLERATIERGSASVGVLGHASLPLKRVRT